MSDYEDYDYTPAPATDGPKQKGISADSVMRFRKFVLGDHSGPIEPLIEDRPEEQTRAVAPGAGPAPRQNGRFPPGQSGNPKGRPKKGFSPRSIPAPEVNLELLAGIVRKILDREMAVTRDGELLQKTIRDIMFEKQVQKAAQGSTAAARFLHALDMQASQAEAAARAKDYAIWRDRKERYAALHERERKRSGASLYWGCPHPDDIILGPGHTVKVLGPMDPKALQRTKERYERATYWLLLATYEGWLQVRRAKTHPGCPHIHAELVSAYMFEAEQELLPPRLRMPREAVAAQVEAWSDLAGRAMHDLLRAEAAKADMPVPPRALRLPFTVLHPIADKLVSEQATEDNCSAGGAVCIQKCVADVLHAAWAQIATVHEAPTAIA